MRLAATGLFARASRNARLAVLASRAIPPVHSSTRRASTQAAEKQDQWRNHPEAFPDQSSVLEQELEPRRIAARTPSKAGTLDHPTTTLANIEKEILKKNEPNKIVHGHGGSGVLISSTPYIFDGTSNVPPSILSLINRQLYDTPNHPLCITRRLIESVFPTPQFKNFTVADPVATTYNNFDVLGFPADHPGRSRTDTYYINSSNVLRTHTSAHQHAAFKYLLNHPEKGYTICADVFRRDSIDRSHFPVFHQMEGARVWAYEPSSRKKLSRYQMQMDRQERIRQDVRAIPANALDVVENAPAYNLERNPRQLNHDEQDVILVVDHLKKSLERLVQKVFSAAQEAGLGGSKAANERLKVRWVEAYFPFTSPSFELEVFWQGEWLELLGCGVVQHRILSNAGLKDHIAWAWGIGVERLAMLLFGIPDIRLFWSQDRRFLDQFSVDKIKKFEPFSKYPACYKDVAFWIDAAPASASPIASNVASAAAAAGGDATKASPDEAQPAAFHENDVMEIVRDVAGSLAEDVSLADEFIHPKTGRKSLCYRINYRSLEKTLTNEEVNKMHSEVIARLGAELPIELR